MTNSGTELVLCAFQEPFPVVRLRLLYPNRHPKSNLYNLSDKFPIRQKAESKILATIQMAIFAFPAFCRECPLGLPQGPKVAKHGCNLNSNRRGLANFSTSDGYGTYRLTVLDITKTGYSFDAANSVQSKSITR